MKISILQTENEGRNEFDILIDDVLKYRASLPFISIDEPMNLEKLRKIKLCDTEGTLLYKSSYHYLENLKEEFIPYKFLLTGSQKFNQLVFSSEEDSYRIYYEEQAIWDNRYVIESENERIFVYSVEDGYIRHFPIYLGDLQIGEALKSNVLVDGKDEYVCYLEDAHRHHAIGVAALFLYLDRFLYSSSYLLHRSYRINKSYSYNKNNKYYDKNWVRTQFGEEFYEKVEDDLALVKEKLKHPLRTTAEQFHSFSPKQKLLVKILLIFAGFSVASALISIAFILWTAS